MTYRYTAERLDGANIESIKAIVGKRPELFRLKISVETLEAWKNDMLGRKRLPAWVKEADNKNDFEKFIAELQISDVFHSRFRILENSEPTKIEIIEWGLQHIDRLRKSSLDSIEVNRRWIKEWLIPILSILVAVVTVICSSVIQYFGLITQEASQIRTIESTEKLKKYEVSFAQRTAAYSKLMDAVDSVQHEAVTGNVEKVLIDLQRIEAAFHQLRPFLSPNAQREFIDINSEYTKFLSEISKRQNGLPLSNEDTATFSKFKLFFADKVYIETFERSPYVGGPVLWPVR